MAFHRVITTALVAVSVTDVTVGQVLLNAGKLSKSDVTKTLEAELAAEHSQRLAGFEDVLRPTFSVLPKNEAGNLGHEAVRYALHRMFIQRHGWFIKGLEPGSDRPAANNSEWVPSYLQAMLESKVGDKGASLHDLAAFAASLEDLIDTETRGRLGVLFEILEVPVNVPVTADQARQVVRAFYISFLLAGKFSATNKWEAERRIATFTELYTDWDSAESWLDGLLDPKLTAKPNGFFTFDEIARIVEDIGETYYKFNDVECHELKGMLTGLEGIKEGRVRLSFFYQKGLHSHWSFKETPEYLRVLGALDDSDTSMPQVIVPNYVMARTNCLDASSLYAICCRNECEDLMGTLEASIGSSRADSKRIADIVAGMSSDTVAAPRSLPSTLLMRLDEIASSNGGSVPLHGRLFAQWMHHAFPRECPYPHEAKENPQTPDEWMEAKPTEAKEMSREDMQKTVEADQCASGLVSGRLPRPEDCGGSSGSELPWTPSESLLGVSPSTFPFVPVYNNLVQEADNTAASTHNETPAFGVFRAIAVLGLVGFLLIQGYQLKIQADSRLKDKCQDDKYSKMKNHKLNVHAVVVFSVSAAIAFLLDLLDTAIFVCSLVGAVVSVAAVYFAKDPSLLRNEEDMCNKCVV